MRYYQKGMICWNLSLTLAYLEALRSKASCLQENENQWSELGIK